MAIGDIPVFREARRGQVVRSDDWNDVQRALRNSVRTHRHTRVAGGRFSDVIDDDLAPQITTDEIADGAVTPAKLGSGVFDSLLATARVGTETNGAVNGNGTGAAQQVATDVLALAPLARQQVEHGLGRVPVAVTVGIHQSVTGLTGDFELYGGSLDRGGVVAAVPVEPDGTFVLVSTADEKLTVRWWVVAGSNVTTRSAPQRLTQESTQATATQAAPKRAPRRGRSARARQE